MIKIRAYSDYFKALTSRITGLNDFLLVTTETDLGYKIKDMPLDSFPVLVVVIPSSDSISADPDNILESNTALIYVLQMTDAKELDSDSFLEVMETTQDLMEEVKGRMAVDKSVHGPNHLMHRVDLNRMHTDPEYNYLGCVGWSLSFNLLTAGF